MAGKLGRSKNQRTSINMAGGLATRPTNEMVEAMSDGKVFLTDCGNIELYKSGAMSRSTGFTPNANRPDASSVWMTQASQGASPSISTSVNDYVSVYFKITPGSTRKAHVLAFVGTVTPTAEQLVAYIYSNSGGLPSSVLATSEAIVVRQETDAISTQIINGKFIFNAPPTLTSGTDYWIRINLTRASNNGVAVTGDLTLVYLSNPALTTPTDVLTDPGNATRSNAGANGFPYYTLESATPAIQGLYNVLSESSGTIGQDIVAFQNGGLYPMTTPSAPTTSGWDAVLTGASALGAGQDVLGDYKTLNNLHFFSDYSTNIQRVWDAAASYAMVQGFRPTFSLAQSASAGGPWSAAGLVKLMGIVTLSSGGYRATAIGSITLSGTTNKIDITSITNSIGAATDLGFDAGLLNMAWYATLPNGAVYYKVPNASISGGANTNPNTNATNFSILPTTDAVLIAGGSLDLNLGIPQAAFTLQVATPKFKFMGVFASCLVGAGDPDNPSRVWFSWQGGPQIYSTYGKVYGNYIDVSPEDGQIITSIHVADGRLYVGKNNSLYFIDYTANANDPFSNPRKIHGQEGVQSHWTMNVVPKGLWYLSPRGPALCYGTYSEIDPAADKILNLFDAGDADRFNVTTMAFSTAVNYVERQQIWMTFASSSSATLRDKLLVYDYGVGQYWIVENQPSNIVSLISDSNGNNRLFVGAYYGKIARKAIESEANAFLSDGSYNPASFTLPDLSLSNPADWKEGGYLSMAGAYNAIGAKIYIDFYKNGGTNIVCTSVINTSNVNFPTGVDVQIPFLFKSLQLRMRTLYSPEVGFQIDWMRFEYTDTGVRR